MLGYQGIVSMMARRWLSLSGCAVACALVFSSAHVGSAAPERAALTGFSRGSDDIAAAGDKRIIVGQNAVWRLRPWCYRNGEPVDDVVTVGISGQPNTGGATAKAQPNPVHTFTPLTITVTTTTRTKPGRYRLTISGRGPKCGTYRPALLGLIVAPKIKTNLATIWWINGQKPAGYKTEVVLNAEAAGFGPYNWTIRAGTAFATFGNGQSTITTQAAAVKVLAAKGSNAVDDVRIVVTVNNAVSDPQTLTVNTPHSLVHLRDVHQPIGAPYTGYRSEVHYRIRDQFKQVLPSSVPLNEIFTTGVIDDYPGTDWQRGPAGGATVSPQDWADGITYGTVSGGVPTPQSPQTPLGTTKVHHFRGGWQIGSVTPGVGKRVQENNWQRFRDHALHTSIVSPVP